ncbi:DUF1254 domain-containing protein [Pseudomonas sp. L13]|uniref:DUF1254 domain-containing protein n=1 Tax=Pseudomonas sp. L13 TaxID=343985 RepID=UPI0021158301|nr:DUF1254 domain-containing protein [Pseudomonas sp. L13]
MVLNSYEDKLGVITANATTPYILGFVDLNETGPLVVELPPGPTAGGVGDFWQRAIIDMGETGPDKGKGGKYLVLPPGAAIPADSGDYYLAKSETMNVLVGFRVLDPDPGKGKALVEKFRMYPYSNRAQPTRTNLLTPGGKAWSGTQPKRMAYWERLHQIIQKEPVNERDRFYMAMLASLEIEKDKPFNPAEAQRKALEQGAQMGELVAKANTFAKRFPGVQYWPDRQWDTVLNIAEPSQRVAFYDQLWERSAWFYDAVTNTKGMVSRTPGLGPTYLGSYTDEKGDWLDGKFMFEVTPLDTVRSISGARGVMEDCGQDNAGLFLDIWHLSRGSMDHSEIRTLPASMTHSIGLAGADRYPLTDLIENTCHTAAS